MNAADLDPSLRRPLLFLVAAPLAAGIGFAAVGPYGTYEHMALPARLAYWVAIVWANWLQVTFAAKGLARLLPPPRWPLVVPVGLAACLASAAATAEVKLLNQLLMPDHQGAGFAELYFLVLLITLPLTFLVQRAFLARAETEVAAPASAPAATPSRFLERLPAKLGRELLCVKTEDHYLRVFTPLGDDLILMRMADAEAELAPLDGLRVHRSWWVARGAVASVTREAGGRITLSLKNGLQVPVARSSTGALRAAGWPEP
jgi:hypothetical protein